MDSYFPSPLPDESLYSLITRYRISLPHSNNHASQIQFGYMDAFHHPDSIGQNASIFYQRHSEFWTDERAFLRSMTACNLYYSFLLKSVQRRFYKALQGFTGQVTSLLRPHLYYPNLSFFGMKYCKNCITDDIKKYGVAYWHRNHCIWFVRACWKHGCQLTDIENKNSFELPPQDESQTRVLKQVSHPDKAIAILVNELLMGKLPWWASISDLHDSYLRTISVQGMDLRSTANSIQNQLTEAYSTKLLHSLKVRATFNGIGKRCWMYDALITRRPIHIPEHLLVICTLYGSINNLRREIIKYREVTTGKNRLSS